MAKAHTIVIVANTAWNIYNFRRGLYHHLSRQGYDVVTMARPDKYGRKLEAQGIRFVPLEALVPSQISWFKDVDFVKEMSVKLKAVQPDLLLLFTAKPNIYGNYVAINMQIPTISTLTGIGSVFTLGGWRAAGISKMYKIALKHSKSIVFHNSDDLELFRDRKIIPSGKGMVIPGSGIDCHAIAPSPGKDEGPRTFLLMARMIEDKGIRSFMAASTKIVEKGEEVQFIMIGEQPEGDDRTIPKEEIDRWATHPHCTYHHFVEDVFPYIEKSDVVVLPSWREGMPRVILEAMAVGRPVLTTDVPGCRQAVEAGKTGFLVEPRSDEALYEGLITCCNLPAATLKSMGRAGRKRVEEQFDSHIINEAYLGLIREHLPIYKRLFY